MDDGVMAATYPIGSEVLVRSRGEVGEVMIVEFGTWNGNPIELVHVKVGDYWIMSQPDGLEPADGVPVQLSLF